MKNVLKLISVFFMAATVSACVAEMPDNCEEAPSQMQKVVFSADEIEELLYEPDELMNYADVLAYEGLYF